MIRTGFVSVPSRLHPSFVAACAPSTTLRVVPFPAIAGQDADTEKAVPKKSEAKLKGPQWQARSMPERRWRSGSIATSSSSGAAAAISHAARQKLPRRSVALSQTRPVGRATRCSVPGGAAGESGNSGTSHRAGAPGALLVADIMAAGPGGEKTKMTTPPSECSAPHRSNFISTERTARTVFPRHDITLRTAPYDKAWSDLTVTRRTG